MAQSLIPHTKQQVFLSTDLSNLEWSDKIVHLNEHAYEAKLKRTLGRAPSEPTTLATTKKCGILRRLISSGQTRPSSALRTSLSKSLDINHYLARSRRSWILCVVRYCFQETNNGSIRRSCRSMIGNRSHNQSSRKSFSFQYRSVNIDDQRQSLSEPSGVVEWRLLHPIIEFLENSPKIIRWPRTLR